MLRRRDTLVVLAVAVLALLPGAARAATYSFAMPASAIRLGGLETGSSSAFQLGGTNGLRMSTPPLVFAAGAHARRWLGLPGGAVFRSIGGQISAGSGNATAGPLRVVILVQRPDGATATPYAQALTPGLPATGWAAPSGLFASALRLSLEATATGSCAACVAELDSLSGQVDDAQPPTSVTLAAPLAGRATASRAVQLRWSVTDAAAGPANVFLELNGVRQTTPLRVAPAANTQLLTGQRSGGAATVAGTATTTLPDVDAAYQLRVTGLDAVGNQTTSAPVTVTLDRAAPLVSLATPTGWCSHACPVTLTATDPSGIASLSADIDGVPILLPAPGVGEQQVVRSFDARAAGVEGAVALHIRALDTAGNVVDRTTTVSIDSTPPLLSHASADPATRRVSVDVADLSGVQRARATVMGRSIALATAGAARGGALPLAGTITRAAVPGDLDGQRATLEIVDAAGNTARSTLTFRARTATSLVAIADHRRVRAGARIRITGAIAPLGAAGDASLVVTLRNAHWRHYSQRWRTPTRRGHFSLLVRPRISGTLRVTFAGDAHRRSASSPIGVIAVRPIIRARFRLLRDAAGAVIGLSVRGALAPANGPPVALTWEAHAPGGTSWFTICRDDDHPTTRHGNIRGTCHLPGLRPTLDFRLAYHAAPAAPFASAASNASTARR